jgi:hypothetical protein
MELVSEVDYRSFVQVLMRFLIRLSLNMKLKLRLLDTMYYLDSTKMMHQLLLNSNYMILASLVELRIS